MKKLILLSIMLTMAMSLFAIDTVNTNEALSYTNVVAQYEQVNGIIGEWRVMASALKSGFAWTMLIPLLLLILSTIATAGVLLVLLLKAVMFFASDKVDKKIEPIEDFITKYIIKLPITFIGKLRGTRKKS